MPLPVNKAERKIIYQILRSSKLTSRAIGIIKRLLHRTIVETIDGNRTLTLEDSGKFFVLDSGSTLTVTLPALSTDMTGVTYTFVVKTANSNGYKIITGDTDSGAAGDQFLGYCMVGTNNAAAAVSAGSTEAGSYTHSQHDHQAYHSMPDENTRYIQNSGFTWPVQTFTAVTGNGNGRMVAPDGLNDCIIWLDSSDGADGGGLAGTTVKLTALGARYWYAEVMLFSGAAECNPTNVFQNN